MEDRAARELKQLEELTRDNSRLRAENAEHIKERSRAVSDRDFFAAQSAKLEAANASLTRRLNETTEDFNKAVRAYNDATFYNPKVAKLEEENAELRKLMARVVVMSDRYCMHNMTIDESDLQNEIELMRKKIAGT